MVIEPGLLIKAQRYAQRLRHLSIRTAQTSHAAATPPIIETTTINIQESTNKKQRTLSSDSLANENTSIAVGGRRWGGQYVEPLALRPHARSLGGSEIAYLSNALTWKLSLFSAAVDFDVWFWGRQWVGRKNNVNCSTIVSNFEKAHFVGT